MFDDFDTQIQSDELTSQYLSEKELQEIIIKEDSTIKLVHIQRSTGYGWRKSFLVSEIGEIISKIKEEKRKEDLERILSDRGIQLRANRSIQVEGSFAAVKEDMSFRQYLYRGNRNVLAQSILVAIAHNINKLHHRIQSGRTGTHLFPLKKTG